MVNVLVFKRDGEIDEGADNPFEFKDEAVKYCRLFQTSKSRFASYLGVDRERLTSKFGIRLDELVSTDVGNVSKANVYLWKNATLLYDGPVKFREEDRTIVIPGDLKGSIHQWCDVVYFQL